MPGPLKGPGKFWNIDPIWGYILLILATNCAFWFSLYFQLTKLFWPPPLLRKTFWSPLLVTQNFFGPPSILPSPPHQSIYEHSLRKGPSRANIVREPRYSCICACNVGLFCLFVFFVCFVLRVKTSMIVFLSNPPSVMHLLVCGPLEFHAFVMYLSRRIPF